MMPDEEHARDFLDRHRDKLLWAMVFPVHPRTRAVIDDSPPRLGTLSIDWPAWLFGLPEVTEPSQDRFD